MLNSDIKDPSQKEVAIYAFTEHSKTDCCFCFGSFNVTNLGGMLWIATESFAV